MADEEILTSDKLYEEIIKRPDWRVVQGIPRDNDRMTPLAFDFAEDGLRFHWDATSTQFHKHGMCDEIIDLLGNIELDNFCAPVLIAEFDCDFDHAIKCRKMSFDVEAKWIKLMPAE